MAYAAFDATADALARQALAQLPDSPTHADLDAVSPLLARLLHARLDAELAHATPAPSAWIDADATAPARDAWHGAAASTLRVPPAERDAVVRHATERALTHLVRPAETLAAVSFERAPGPLPTPLVLARMRAFGPYPYLAQITERYVERKGLSHIDRAGLERLLRRIDRRMVSAFGVGDWMALLEPLFDWVGAVGDPAGTIPADLLRALFQARGAAPLDSALGDSETVDADAVRALIAAALDPSATPSEAAVAGDAPSATPPAPLPESVAPLATSDEPANVGTPSDSAASAEVLSATESADGELFTPPVIGSRYGEPTVQGGESSVLGPPREMTTAETQPVAEPSTTEEPMAQVRDEIAAAAETSPTKLADAPLPSPPVLDMAEDDREPMAVPTSASVVADEPDSHSTDVADDEPIWQRMARKQGAPPPTPADDDEPLWKRFAQSDLAERLPDPSPTDSLTEATHIGDAHAAPGKVMMLDVLEERVLGPDAKEQRDWYVDKLFGGSPSDYHRTLAALDEAPNYTAATAVISEDILQKRSVNPYTDCAVAFIDAVQSQSEQ